MMSTFRSIKPAIQVSHPAGQSSTTVPPLQTISIFDFIDSLTPHERNLVSQPPYSLKISPDDLISTSQQRNNKIEKGPPRAPNAWIIFRKNLAYECRKELPEKPYSIQEISKIAQENWKIQSKPVKEYFGTLAKLALLRHKAIYPDYVYKPKRIKRDNQNKTWLFKEMSRDSIARTEKRRNKRNKKLASESCDCVPADNGECNESMGNQESENNEGVEYIDYALNYPQTQNCYTLHDAADVNFWDDSVVGNGIGSTHGVTQSLLLDNQMFNYSLNDDVCYNLYDNNSVSVYQFIGYLIP
jgi:hypothetical protein